MSSSPDLPKLVMALEYADIAAGLYLSGGSDHAARLLAAGAEALLGDLAKLLSPHAEDDEVQVLLTRVALQYESPTRLPRSHSLARRENDTLERASELAGFSEGEVRQAAAALLRSCWYQLEAIGLEALIPTRLQRAVDESTITAY
ncbi:MAG: hypothetical protein JO006_09720 [Paucibacter sp.]|nr:hypothetical protein [Roseateles sp.]